MSAAEPGTVLPDPPDHVTSTSDQDSRLVRKMLAMTPAQRLETLRNWAAVAGEPGKRTTTP